MRVILAGGGTGGHLFPGLAVAREFQRRDAMTEILFVGTEKGIEARVLPHEGFRLETIAVKGLKGRGVRGLLDALYGIPAGSCNRLESSRGFDPTAFSASADMHPDRCCWRRSCGASAALSWNKTFNRALPIRCWHALSIRFLLHTARLPPTCQAKRCWRQEIQCVGRGCRMRPKVRSSRF